MFFFGWGGGSKGGSEGLVFVLSQSSPFLGCFRRRVVGDDSAFLETRTKSKELATPKNWAVPKGD